MAKPEVLIVGIDGATFELIDPWIKQGYLANIGGLMQQGVRANLASTLTPNTCPAWKSFSTGRNPGRLGVFNWRNKVYESYDVRLAEPGLIPGRDLWDIIGSSGRKVAVVGVPMTYPPQPVNGVLLSGMLTPPNAVFAWPPELVREIEDEFGEYRLDPAVVSEVSEDELFEDQNAVTINRFQVLRHVLQRDVYDFVMVVFTAADRLQHLYWPPPGTLDHAVLKTYLQIDTYIGQLRGFIDEDTTVLLMSDHGFTKLDRFMHVNQVLSDMGLLKVANQGGNLLQRVGVTRQSLGRLARRVGLNDLRASMPEAAKRAVPPGRFGLDMDHTQAFGWSSGEIFINLRGREPQGIVNQGLDYSSLRDRIIERFENLTDNGRRVRMRVYKREEIYSGDYLLEAPDLVIDMKEPGYGMNGSVEGSDIREILPGTVFSDNRGMGGRHDTTGILVAGGPEIRRGEEIDNARIIDIAPTVLHAMGLPVPDDIDGSVLPVFREDSEAARRPVRRVAAEETEAEPVMLSESERERLQTVLKGFGYLG